MSLKLYCLSLLIIPCYLGASSDLNDFHSNADGNMQLDIKEANGLATLTLSNVELTDDTASFNPEEGTLTIEAPYFYLQLWLIKHLLYMEATKISISEKVENKEAKLLRTSYRLNYQFVLANQVELSAKNVTISYDKGIKQLTIILQEHPPKTPHKKIKIILT